ncbi:MAG: hypothetical protein L6Q71_08960, partial [Planctomycetes bacterium]|nr:hypothetical protein [Planctomycetota bacterium]
LRTAKSLWNVIPAKAGIQRPKNRLDSGFRRYDGKLQSHDFAAVLVPPWKWLTAIEFLINL